LTAPSKICYVAPDVPVPSPRGSSVHVLELAGSLLSLGCEVHVISRRTSPLEKPFENLNGLFIHRVYRSIIFPQHSNSESIGKSSSEARRGLKSWLYLLYLRTVFSFYVSLVATRIIRRYKLEVIMERETSFGAGGLASIFSGKPMILEIVGPRYSRISVWRSQKILYYTESMLRKWVDKKKCIQVSGGVNLSLFRQDIDLRENLRKELGFGSEKCVLGYVGTFQDWHGIDTLLYSIKDLKDKYPKLRALLVGPYYEKYQNMSENLGIEEICTFVGPIEHEKIAGYINACDIMIALYEPNRNALRREFGIGSPLKILEYMACGKLVISTDVPPVDSVIRNGVSGYLVKPANRRELELAISDLMEDSSKIPVLAANGMKTAQENFSWSSLAKLVLEVLSRES
jgi:glycosyltransferase involved in cell wall biosynthesis